MWFYGACGCLVDKEAEHMGITPFNNNGSWSAGRIVCVCGSRFARHCLLRCRPGILEQDSPSSLLKDMGSRLKGSQFIVGHKTKIIKNISV